MSHFSHFYVGGEGMRVHPSQLIEGCILMQNVLGKSGRPIMPAKTVLTDNHITVLHKFLIDSVEVSSKLVDGKTYMPKEVEVIEKIQPQIKESEIYSEQEELPPFSTHYLQAVEEYKRFYTEWNNGIPIDMSKIRRSIIPLLERIEELDMEIFTLHQFGTAKDYNYHHSVAISLISAFLGKELGYRKGEWIQLGLAGYLCDAGMTRVDSEITSKGDPLTESQHQEIRNHSTYSYRMVENITGLSKAAKIAILQHHERIDGSGYPLGLMKDKINTYARILAVSDTYHAMTSERLYKAQQPIFKVIDEIAHERFTKLDPLIVRKFIESLTARAVGKTVSLTNNKKGEIVFIDKSHLTRPIVKLHDTEEIISLQMNPGLHIEEVMLD